MMTPEAAACFDRFTASAFRLEVLHTYRVDSEQQEIEDWRAGRPRPEYSVRTVPWLARIATDTLAGKNWRRVRVVDLPPSEYLRWQLLSYVESAVAGEEIRIVDRARHPETAAFTEDFWLFDADTPRPFAIAMVFDDLGRPGEHRLVMDPARVARYRQVQQATWDAGVPLNAFLASLDVLRLTA